MQTGLEKKNWNSLIMFKFSETTTINPYHALIDSVLHLDPFEWLEDNNHIGAMAIITKKNLTDV